MGQTRGLCPVAGTNIAELHVRRREPRRGDQKQLRRPSRLVAGLFCDRHEFMSVCNEYIGPDTLPPKC